MRVFVLVICMFCSSSAFAVNYPSGWPWHGVTSDVMSIEREPNIVGFFSETDIKFIRIHISVRSIKTDKKLSSEKALLLGLENAKKFSKKLSDVGIISMLSISDFPVNSNECRWKSKETYWKKNGICVNQIYKFVEKTVQVMSNSTISAYEFLAEPVTKVKINFWQDRYVQPKEWLDICRHIIDLVRKSGDDRWLVMSLGPWALPDNYDDFVPFSDKKVVYDIHMYQPFLYAFQGIKGHKDNIKYPGIINTRSIFPIYDKHPNSFWDKKLLTEVVQPLINFQKRYSVPIFVGEFGAVIWAPNRDSYLTDSIDTFEKNSWGWAYFNIGSRWHGFDPRFAAKKKSNGKYGFEYVGHKAEGMQVLKNYFGLEKK